MNQNTITLNQELILALIEQLIYKGGKSNFVIIHLNTDYYIQMAAARGDYELYCEAVSDYYLMDRQVLSNTQKDTLAQLNWNAPQDTEANYILTHQVDSEQSRAALADLILRTAQDVYNCQYIEMEDILLNLE